MMTQEEMERHIGELAVAHNFTVTYDPALYTEEDGVQHPNGESYSKRRAVNTAPLRGEAEYAVALHEIGHVMDPLTSTPRYQTALFFTNMGMLDGTLELVYGAEQRAWAWARANAKVWTSVMEAQYAYNIESYRRYLPGVQLPLPLAA